LLRIGIAASAKQNAGGGGASAYRTAVLADSPYCYFPLDDASTPTDVMGVVTTDQVVGVTLGVAGIGDGATAASFDGGAVGGGIRIPNTSLPDMGTMNTWTVEIIAKATDNAAQRALFGRESQHLLRHTNAPVYNAFTGSGGWANQIQAGYSEAAQTATHHWALVCTIGGNSSLYRDGVEVLTEITNGAPAAVNSAMYIGGRVGTDRVFLGSLAGFAYYTTALSPARILAHAQAAGVA
jgi:hypothetical protein